MEQRKEGKEMIHGTKASVSFLLPLKYNEEINTFMGFLR